MQHLPTNTLLQGGKYKIERVLGQGGFGITYLAVQTMLGRVVCIKEFFLKDFCTRTASGEVVTGTAASSEFVERYRNKFIKEARIISRFDHPNIVHVLDTFTENGTAYYVMEYIEGASLDEIIRRDGAMPEDKAMGYIKQVARALDYIHQRSVNHLDVKPANIMVSRGDNRAILIDFGVSKQYDEQGEQTSSTPIGISHGYAPIEQYRAGGVSTFSPQSDIYALGATLYKLITGNTPPQPSDIINDGLPQQSNNVSAELKNLISQAMQIRKGDRPDSVDCFMRVSLQSETKDNITISLHEGERIEVNSNNVEEYLTLAEQGSVNAQFCLGAYYSRNIRDIQGYLLAIEWYRKAAEQGHVEAQCCLGACYYSAGYGLQDYRLAVEWYRKAAERGNADAQYMLGSCYEMGYGVDKSYSESEKWYRKAAEQGSPEAQYCIGVYYEVGCIVEKSLVQAFEWYNQSALQGYPLAKIRIEREELYTAWKDSWKGRVYDKLKHILEHTPKPIYLMLWVLLGFFYLLMVEVGVIKDIFHFMKFGEDRGYAILSGILSIVFFYYTLRSWSDMLNFYYEKIPYGERFKMCSIALFYSIVMLTFIGFMIHFFIALF